MPEIVVIPESLARALRAQPNALSDYAEALPLVIEIWSSSTGGYDASVKLANYQRRGDLEIWFVHPVEGTLRAWRSEPDGTYAESVYHGGIVNSAARPQIAVDLDEFAAQQPAA